MAPKKAVLRSTDAYVAFARLVKNDPRMAYHVWNELQGLVGDAKYPRLELGKVPIYDADDPDANEEEKAQQRDVLIDPYTKGIATVSSVDIDFRVTAEDEENEPDFTHKTVSFYYDSESNWEGLVYIVSSGDPVRLPEGWKEI